jgi:plastocyanin
MAAGKMDGMIVVVSGGCAVPYTTGLPSASHDGERLGPAALTFLDDWLYLANNGGGAARGNPDYPSGVYAIDTNGGWAITSDIGSWLAANPPRERPPDFVPDGNPIALAAAGDDLLLVEASSRQLLRVAVDGAITRVADLAAAGEAPSALAVGRDGSAYVAFRTTPPYPDGAAKVVRVTPEGEVSDAWTGLTAISALAIGPDDTLYAAELATGNASQAPFLNPGTGKVVRQTGPDTHQDVAIGLDFPRAMSFGPDRALYVAVPGSGGGDLPGGIIRLDLAVPQPMRVLPGLLQASSCPVVGGAVMTTATAAAASPSPVPVAAATPVPAASPQPSAGSVSTVTIVDFSFSPADITVAPGTVVTWTNNDSVPHTATAADGSFDSGNLSPGESFNHTFSDAGAFAYACQYHPNMKGTVTVS